MENANEVLEYLLQTGKISKNDVDFAIQSNPPRELKDATNLIHTLCCTFDHRQGCEYYQETTQEFTWTRSYHEYWIRKVTDMMGRIGFESFYLFLTTLTQLQSIIRSELNPTQLRILVAILELNPQAFALPSSSLPQEPQSASS